MLIGKAGKPVARRVAYRGAVSRRVPRGALAGRIKIHPEFDVLREDIAEAFGAGAQ